MKRIRRAEVHPAMVMVDRVTIPIQQPEVEQSPVASALFVSFKR
jgi:hypothetical protein